jgi:hypothetical protein
VKYRELVRQVLASIVSVDQRLEYDDTASPIENRCARCKVVYTTGGARYVGEERYVPICWECSRHVRLVPTSKRDP